MDNSKIPRFVHGDSYFLPSQRLLFLCVPKVGSRTILNVLRAAAPDGWRLQERDLGSTAFFAKYPEQQFRFGFVRHPYSRALSFYYDKFSNYDGSEGKKAMFARHPGLRPEMPLKEFLRWLAGPDGADGRSSDPHYTSQHLYLYTRDGKQATDHIGRIESLETDLTAILTRFKLPVVEIPRLNSNIGPARKSPIDTMADPAQYLDAEDSELLYKRYEKDFTYFGFKR